MDADSDVNTLPTHLLLVHIERCERLLSHPLLLSRLPDGGESIRARHTLFVAERKRREANGDAAIVAKSVDAVVPHCKEKGVSSTDDLLKGMDMNPRETNISCRQFDSKNILDRNTEESYKEAVQAMTEKYRHYRIPVEAIVRRTFGGSLSETEIQRILDDVPPNYFLTHDETMSLQRKLLKEERLDALEMLRRQQE
ncbi:putative protein kinase [Trypanosoma theileri]|uniref:Uncharacterized protein n=1 Tax=Trypanosoma theileri TaxID=67003 RepID=A0A1X0NWA0_9TRYP|nr:putative protein kinase [Trypanosoma theileri]ORC88479.1 putative protein kinase [Trypanosoma theileri]